MVKRLKAKKKNGHANGNGNGQIQHAGRGRPTKYNSDYPRQAKAFCRLGATDAELADFFQVTISTLRLWMVQYSDFSEAVKVPKGIPDDRMEQSLYMRGRGYWIDIEKIFLDKFGDVIRVPTREWIQPDTAAAFIWLKNRRPDVWRDKHEVDVSGKIEHHFTLNIFEKDLSTPKTIDAEPVKRLSGK